MNAVARFSVVALLALACLPVRAQVARGFPASKPETGSAFDFQEWLKHASTIDHDSWNKRHPDPHNGWFGADSDDCARKYTISWGPLGIRTLMHDHTWGNLPAFCRAWPASLLDAKGDLVFDCFEVLDVNPGSPADGHLQKGDLLVAMDGEMFRTALALRPQGPKLKFQESRGLEMDAGEKLDRAEGRGRVAFDVIRAAGEAKPVAGVMVNEAQVTGELLGGGQREVELDVAVAAGQELAVWFDITRGNNGSCGVDVIRPRLEGSAGTLDLSAARRMIESSGYGKVSVGAYNDGKPIQYKGKAEPSSVWIHAPGSLGWTVPDGYSRFRATLVCNPSAAGVKARVLTRAAPRSLPPTLAGQHQVVSFPIPKLGSYGRGFPNNNDAKSALVAKMTAAWLAAQQQPDGSWKRTCGYTNNGYDTAWAGLGLLAHADPAYNETIRKAAEYIAFRCPQDHWTVPNAMMVAFLSEYWLRTKDNRILIALQSQVERVQAEMVYGDFNSGHGHTPGYRGTGVSIGGSHLAFALALAQHTPVKVEPSLVDRMLARAQELAPDGYIPYGRETSTRKFEPNLEGGATYSGRHAPYLVASMIHGGPRLFTQNCSAMYSQGEVGGIDQGHATQSLSTTWALIASANVSPQALERQTEALRWKLTMLRSFDGGFGWNAYRLEYQGGEGLLPNYLRSGAYLVAFNAHKRNMAMTGAPQFRAKQFPDVPPVCHQDAVALGYYRRNWGIVDAALAAKSPPRLRAGLKRLLEMGKGADTRRELFDFLKKEAEPTAREILALSDVFAERRQYFAEMVLGVDVRITADLDRKDDKDVPGMWNLQADIQHPLAGWLEGASGEEKAAWRKNPPLPMEGGIEIVDAAGKLYGNAAFKIIKDCSNDGWHTRTEKSTFASNASGPLPLVAKVRYKVGDMNFSYDRSITGCGDEPGSGEKQRKVLNDRVVWVKGRLFRDLNAWSSSFTLPSGQFISAATQGGALRVSSGDESWVVPEEGILPAGTECDIGFTSGWQAYEGRVAGIRLGALPLVVPAQSITAAGKPLELAALSNFDREVGQTVSFPDKIEDALELDVMLTAQQPVRAVDMRLKGDGRGMRMAIEAEVGGRWQMVFQGRPGETATSFPPVTTKRLRVQLSREEAKTKEVEIQELRVIRSGA